MGLPNRVSGSLAKEQVEAFLGAVNTIRQSLPFLVSLKSDDRKKLVRIDESSQQWTTKMMELASQNPGFLPRDFDLDEMKRDVALWTTYTTVHQAMVKLFQEIEDTYMAVAVDAYSAALAVYAIGSKSDVGTDGLEPLMDELSKRFVHKAGKVSEAAAVK